MALAIHPEDAQHKKGTHCHKVNHFGGVCSSVRNRKIHDLEKEPDQCQEEDHIDMVNINSINFNSIVLVITVN